MRRLPRFLFVASGAFAVQAISTADRRQLAHFGAPPPRTVWAEVSGCQPVARLYAVSADLFSMARAPAPATLRTAFDAALRQAFSGYLSLAPSQNGPLIVAGGARARCSRRGAVGRHVAMREGLEEDGVSSQAGVEGQGAEPPGGAAPAAKAVGGAQNACTGAFGSSGLVGDDRLFPDEADTTPAYLRWG